MKLHDRRVLSLASFVLVACPAGPGDPGNESATETSTSTSATGVTTGDPDPTIGPTSTQTSSTSTGATSSTGDPSSTGSTVGTSTGEPVATTGVETTGSTTEDDTTSTSSTTTGDSGDLPDTTGGEVCEAPGPDDAAIEWDLELPPGLAGTDVAGPCTIVGSKKQGAEVIVDFSCVVDGADEDVVLRYTVKPAQTIQWAVGTQLEIDYRFDQPFWTREWLAVTDSSDQLVMGAIRADALVPPGTTTDDFFKRDITVSAPCDAVADPCGMRQGLALDFLVYSGDRPGVLTMKSGEYVGVGFPVVDHIWVERATRLLDPIDCDDVPSPWIDAMILVDSSGF